MIKNIKIAAEIIMKIRINLSMNKDFKMGINSIFKIRFMKILILMWIQLIIIRVIKLLTNSSFIMDMIIIKIIRAFKMRVTTKFSQKNHKIKMI